MTLASWIMTFYPAAHLLLVLGIIVQLFRHPSFIMGLCAMASLYLVPPFAFRIHGIIFGSNERALHRLSEHKYCAWWGGHQIQLLFLALPALEAVLRMVPGVYSGWLRLWGSKVGRGVYWTPLVEIADRDLLEIGDHVIFGHKVGCYSHVVKPKADQMIVYTAPIKIGSQVFLGAGARLGPGVCVESGTRLPVLTDLYVNQKVAESHDLTLPH